MSIVSLAEKKKDGTLWSVEQMLQDSIEEVRNGKRKASKAIVVFLDDEEDKYNVGYSQSGMKTSEMIALLDVAKIIVKKEMGY